MSKRRAHPGDGGRHRLRGRLTDFPGSWGGLVSQRRGAQSRFFGFDGQQNARVLTDEAGNVTDSYVYTAFGEEKG